MDVRAFNEWEHKVHECIQQKIASLRRKRINRRKKHVLKCRKHVEFLKLLHDRYVLVPADKAVNVIVVCRKYYLEVVTKEISAITTYVVMRGWIKSAATHYIKATYALRVLYQLPKCCFNLVAPRAKAEAGAQVKAGDQLYLTDPARSDYR